MSSYDFSEEEETRIYSIYTVRVCLDVELDYSFYKREKHI